VPAILKKFVAKEATSEAAILKLYLEPGHVYVTSFHLTRNWWQGEKTATDFVSFTRSANVFFPSDYPLQYLHYYQFWSLEHVWLKIIWLKNSYNPSGS